MTDKLVIPKNFTETALILPKNLSFEEWAEVGKTLGKAGHAVMWWLGDWWAYGEQGYGERAAAAVKHEYAFQTLMNAGSVSRKIKTSRRREVVSWPIHAEVASLDAEEQEELLAWAEDRWNEKKPVTVREMRQAVRLTKARRFSRTPQNLPSGKYRVIYADPPWHYGNEPPRGTTSPADHYALMDLQSICDLPVHELVMDNAVLFLWVPSPILREAFEVIDAWGFEYKTSFVWDKVKHNMGHYNSVRHEFLLVCVKGSCTPDVQKLFDSVVTEERRGHSEKPDIFYEIIDTIYPEGPRIELFARKSRPNWDVWGDQRGVQ